MNDSTVLDSCAGCMLLRKSPARAACLQLKIIFFIAKLQPLNILSFPKLCWWKANKEFVILNWVWLGQRLFMHSKWRNYRNMSILELIGNLTSNSLEINPSEVSQPAIRFLWRRNSRWKLKASINEFLVGYNNCLDHVQPLHCSCCRINFCWEVTCH